MGRRRKGRDISGWVIIDKPAGITSTSVVNKVRWAFQAKKAGHAGTLDPTATGLLAVALGEATKTIPFVTDATKCYEFRVALGAATNTDDTEGEIVATSEMRPSDADIQDAMKDFIGDILQVPPKFSAVKIEGERAYNLARAGDDVELQARPLNVEDLRLLDRPDENTAVCEMVCGKGGYVRSIARDLGAKLGCFGHVITLRRVWSGPFDLDQAVNWDVFANLDSPTADDNLILPVEVSLEDIPMGTTNAEGATRIQNGNPGLCICSAEYGDMVWVSYDGNPLAIGRYKSGEIHPSRVFNL